MGALKSGIDYVLVPRSWRDGVRSPVPVRGSAVLGLASGAEAGIKYRECDGIPCERFFNQAYREKGNWEMR